MRRSNQDLPAELDGVVDRLLAHRAELTPLDLDRIKLESRSRAAGVPRINLKRENTHVMKTRTSILAVLASGVLLSSTGAALGVSGLASSGSAGNAQYQVTPTGSGGAPTVKGASSTTAPSAAGTASGTAPAAAVAQPGAQQSLDSGSELPFTGWAAIPVLLVGLMLLGAGVVMRRRTSGDQS